MVFYITQEGNLIATQHLRRQLPVSVKFYTFMQFVHDPFMQACSQ